MKKKEGSTRSLQADWPRAQVADICLTIDYGHTASAKTYESGPRFLRITDIQDGQVHWDTVPGCEISTANEAALNLRDGDIVFARTGGTTGKSFLLAQPPRAVFASYLIRLRVDTTRVMPSFLHLFFQSDLYWQQLRGFARGGAQPNVNATLLGRIELPLAPLAQQELIAAELTAALSAVEKARRAAQERLAAAVALPGAYLREVFEGHATTHWQTRRLGDVCDLLPSKSIATASDFDVTAITTACLSERGFLPSGVKRARMWSSDAALCRVSTGEVLIARSNTPALVGRVSMYAGDPPDVVASDLTIRLWPRDGLAPPFLASHLSYLFQTGYWRERAGGTSGSMKKITREQISDEEIPVPPLEDQRRIAAALSEKLAAAEKLTSHLREELAAIEALPGSLLRRAFGGEPAA